MAGHMADGDDPERVLHEIGWLAGFPAPFRKIWLANARTITVERGEAVYREGDEGRCFYGLVTGTLAITIGPPLLAPRLVNIMNPGTWFGVGPMLKGEPRNMEFRAAEPARLVRVSGAAIDQMAERDPLILRHVGRLAMWGHDLATRIAAELLIPSSNRRTAAVILRIASPDPMDGRVGESGICVTQSQIAEMANVSRNLANTALGELRAAGWIETRYNRLLVRNPAALAAFVHGDD